jgi:hypothetical protein
MGIFAPEDSTVRRLLAFNPEIESGYNSTARYRWIKWPDGSTAQLFETGKGTSDRLRGSMARCCDIYDDLDGWNDRKILMSQAVFGLRAGPARWAGAVTRAARFDDRIAVTEVGADVNTNLSEEKQAKLAELRKKFDGTRVGLREAEEVTGQYVYDLLQRTRQARADDRPGLRELGLALRNVWRVGRRMFTTP